MYGDKSMLPAPSTCCAEHSTSSPSATCAFDETDSTSPCDERSGKSLSHGKLPPRIFLLLENKSKSNNLGTELRCAAAFGVEVVVVAGFNRFADYGSHGASKHVRVVAFPTAVQASNFLRDECGCESIIGLLGCVPDGYSPSGYPVLASDIDPNVHVVTPLANSPATQCIEPSSELLGRSFPITSAKFHVHNSCVAIAKQLDGLPRDLARLCDKFVHVPHVAVSFPVAEAAIAGDDESPHPCLSPPPLLLNAPSLLSITLHHLTEHLGYDESAFQGHKYEVAQLKKQRDEQFACQEQIRRLESRKDQDLVADTLLNDGAIISLFSVDGHDHGEY